MTQPVARAGRMVACLAGVLMGIAAALLAGAGPAGAQGSCLDYLYDINLYLACPPGPYITASPAADPGGPVHVEAGGWLPGSTLAIAVECGGALVPVGAIAIGPDTTGRADISVPAGCQSVTCGQLVSGTGSDMFGMTVTREAPMLLPACSFTSTTTIPRAELPLTGSESGRLVTVGSALVVIGAAALYGSVRARAAGG